MPAIGDGEQEEKVAKTGIHDAEDHSPVHALRAKARRQCSSELHISRDHPHITGLPPPQIGKLKAWQLVTDATGGGAEWHRGAYVSATIALEPAWSI